MAVSAAGYARLEDETTIRHTGKDVYIPRCAINRYNYAMHCFYMTHSDNENLSQYKGKFLWLNTNDSKKPGRPRYQTLPGMFFRFTDCCSCLFLFIAIIVTLCM